MSTENPLAAVDTVCAEAKAFAARHPDLPEGAQATGMLMYGLLRAFAECPECPGHFRVSPDGWHTLVCRQCRGVWTYQPTPVEAPKPSRQRGRREG